jgi:hypothetical protein
MSYEDCFTAALCAPRNETFSYRHLPCRFEYTTNTVATERKRAAKGMPIARPNCPYRGYCDASAGVLSMLERIYGHRIKVTLSEPSATIVVRAEHLYNREERSRLCLRKHFYELESEGQTDATNGARWTDYRITTAGLSALRGNFEATVRKRHAGVLKSIEPLFIDNQGAERTFDDEAAFATSLHNALPLSEARDRVLPWMKERLVVIDGTRVRLTAADLDDLRAELIGQVPTDVTDLFEKLSQNLGARDYQDEGDFKRAVSDYLSPTEEWELIEKLIDHAGSALNCRPIRDGDDGDRFGRYLGFIDLRLNSPLAPLAMGLLALPRRCVNSVAHRFVSGEYGRIFGGPGFPCTLYVMHDPETGGAHCAQSTVIMSLAALSDRGARLNGSFTLTYLAYRASARDVEPNDDNDECLRSPKLNNARPRQVFEVDGLTGEKIQEVLSEHQVSAQWVWLPRRGDEAQRRHLVFRLIEAYVEARCPVIILVDSKTWWSFADHDPEPHAITVVGVRGSSPNVEENGLICHDPGFAPYLERPFDDYFASAANYRDTGLVQLIVAADRRLLTHAMDCIWWLRTKTKSNFLTEYTPIKNDDTARDYRLQLIHRDDLLETLFVQSTSPAARRRFVELRAALIECTTDTRYWCVSTRGNDGTKHWLFDAQIAPAKRMFDDPPRENLPPDEPPIVMGAPVLRINVATPLNGSIWIINPDPVSLAMPEVRPYRIVAE